ncbi:MAG TPA: HAD family phosphatase [Thermopolyspora sp.]
MLKGVLIDWAGVLTTRLNDAIAAWIAAEGIDDARYRDVMRSMVRNAYDDDGAGQENLIHALERGEVTTIEFERALAARLVTLDGAPPVAEGILTRMFAGFQPVEPMRDMLCAARAAGLRTCLVSNSWGNDYPRDGWDDMFDGVVISGEVGMRKPEPRIFEHALGLIGLPPQQCVFIDDIDANVVAARALGISGIHHVAVQETLAELERLFDLSFRPR